MTANVVRVETTPKLGENMRDVRGDSVKRQLKADHAIDISQVRSIVGYLISSQITSEEISQRARWQHSKARLFFANINE